jgi:hypothetical protein
MRPCESLFLSLLATACVAAVPNVAGVADPEIEVVAAALADAAGRDSVGGDSVLILSRSLNARPSLGSRAGIMFAGGFLSPGVLAAFDSANARSRRLESAPVLPGRAVRFADQLSPQRQDEYRRVYYLSRVGFNAARDTAVIGIVMRCGFVCGWADHEVYTRATGAWRRSGSLGPHILF